MRRIFITGGTGFMGQAAIPRLQERGWQVTALARRGSESKLPPGVEVITGNALDASTFDCTGAGTYLHLIGTPHPSPWKAEQFKTIDLNSLQASIAAAKRAATIRHFIFLSVAQPAPIMRAYIAVRAECERQITATGIPATFLRPWYVLGKGRSWPQALKPIYAIAESIPSLREGAQRLGLVTSEQMTAAILEATENPPREGTRILDVPAIRNSAKVT